jgi:hypothetical protein
MKKNEIWERLKPQSGKDMDIGALREIEMEYRKAAARLLTLTMQIKNVLISLRIL